MFLLQDDIVDCFLDVQQQYVIFGMNWKRLNVVEMPLFFGPGFERVVNLRSQSPNSQRGRIKVSADTCMGGFCFGM